ncbi:MAG: hypothetical protein JSR98_17470, partial [Proteobacteria bacterium]|nr:hypothetical protein [Pseudomonadota bacterium]
MRSKGSVRAAGRKGSSMISRRGLLGGLSLLPLAGGLEGCAARAAALAQAQASTQAAQSTTTTSIPVVGPGSRWNGQALSGGAPPTNPTRTSAKPAILWLVPSDLRMVDNVIIGVDADANGGVKQVDFWVEGQVQTVTSPSIYTDTDANGKSRSRYGYWIALNASAFKIISATGEVRIFATAVPNNPAMQSRVIGYDAVSGFDGNYPMRVYPRTTANDFTLTIGAGGTYATVDAAVAAAKTINSGAPAEAPLFQFVSTGFYELNSAASNYGGGKGFATFVAKSGVTATLGRSASFSPTNTASWNWTPGWDGCEFRGSGIVFDQKNWALIAFTSKPSWFNGCKFTNSIGTLFSYYWNGGQHPGYGGTGANYWDDVTTEHVSHQGALGGQRYVQRVASNQYLDDYVSGTHCVVGTYVNSYDISGFIANYQGTPIGSLKIAGPAGATVSKDAADAPNGHLHLRVNGSEVTSIPLGFYASDNNATITALAAAINAFGSGWSATVQNARGAMRPSALTTNFPSGTAFTDVAVSGAGASFAAGFDMHVD